MTAIDAEGWKAICDDMGGDLSVIRELVASYLDEAPKLLAAGREATLANDASAVQHAYHPLKSTSATFGALRLRDLCLAVEQAARTGAIPSLDAVAAIEAEYEAARKELLAKIA